MVDVWGNRIRYAVAFAVAGCTGTSTTPHWTHVANLRANGMTCKPNDLDVCWTSTGVTAVSCNTAARVVDPQTAAFIVWSTGKNGKNAAEWGNDENLNAANTPVKVSHGPSSSYDDLMVVVPATLVYQKLVAAGVLP
jgi:hypothetical protein